MSQKKNRRGYDFKDLNELNETGTLLGRVGYKPVSSVYILCIAAALFLLIGHLFGIIMALICLAGAGFIQFYVTDHPVMDEYDDAVIFLDPADASAGIRYTPAQVYKWTVNKDSSYEISVSLQSGDIHVAQSYQVSNANRLLKKLMAEKSETRVIQNSYKGTGLISRKKK
jgi:hypothetical protein